jgi:DNA helicase-2/ATP-dependent DNA helicase PcrA
VRFYERKEIKDILAYLRLVLNPEEEMARKRAEKNGKTRLNNLMGKSLSPENNTLDILDEVLRATGYLEQFEETNEEDAARLENIKELRSVAAQFNSLPDFLENIALTEKEAKRRQAQEWEDNRGAVTLMTLHSAKGLEFKQVFMIGMEEGLFPHSRTLTDPEEMEEERRLCYVGMTRAMDKLCLTYAVRRLYFGTRSTNMVSRFLAEIPEDLIENSRPTSPKGFVRGTSLPAQWGFDEEGNWKWKPGDDNF